MPRDICLRYNTPGSSRKERAPAPLPEHRVVRLYISELSVIDAWRSKILAVTLEACVGSTRVGAILLLCGDRASCGFVQKLQFNSALLTIFLLCTKPSQKAVH